MKSRLPSARASTKGARKGNGNGDRPRPNGHSNGHPDGKARADGRRANEVLDGQPSVTSLLGVQLAQNPDGFDKGKLLAALLDLKRGDFTIRLPVDLEGIDGKIADTFNEVV